MATTTKHPRLRQRHKVFICERLARFAAWMEIVEEFSIEYGNRDGFPRADFWDESWIEWLKRRINYYAYDRDAHTWQDLIRELRQEWLQGVKEEALANQRVRVQELSRDHELLRRMLQVPGGKQILWILERKGAILKQIAEEVGDRQTKHQHTVEGAVNLQAPQNIPVVLCMPDFAKIAAEHEAAEHEAAEHEAAESATDEP